MAILITQQLIYQSINILWTDLSYYSVRLFYCLPSSEVPVHFCIPTTLFLPVFKKDHSSLGYFLWINWSRGLNCIFPCYNRMAHLEDYRISNLLSFPLGQEICQFFYKPAQLPDRPTDFLLRIWQSNPQPEFGLKGIQSKPPSTWNNL